MNNLQNTKYPMFYLDVLKKILIIMESKKYVFGRNMNSVLRSLFCGNYINDFFFFTFSFAYKL